MSMSKQKSMAAKVGARFEEEMAVPAKVDVVTSFVVVLNLIVMALELEWEGDRSRVQLGWQEHETWLWASDVFKLSDHIFNAIYLLECVLRLWILRCEYFKTAMNDIDFVLVVASSVQLYILEPLQMAGSGRDGNLTILRMMRMARLARIHKVLRTPLFAELRVLCKTCISSIGALLWSMLLLFAIMSMGGLFLCSVLTDVIRDDAVDHALRVWLFRHYGSSGRAIYTVFEVTLAGCWPNYFRPLIEKVSVWYVLFSIFYITIVVFAVIRIITAMFLKKTLQAASSDAEMLVQEKHCLVTTITGKLAAVFQAVGTSDDGMLTEDLFHLVISNSNVQAWLSSLGLDVYDIEGLFALFDEGEGCVSCDTFLHGILRLKGQARSLDVISISSQCDKIGRTISQVADKVDWLARHGSKEHSDTSAQGGEPAPMGKQSSLVSYSNVRSSRSSATSYMPPMSMTSTMNSACIGFGSEEPGSLPSLRLSK